MATTRVPQLEGHTLLAEGAAFRFLNGSKAAYYRAFPGKTGGYGHGICQCGASSFQYTQTDRKAWHKEHRARVIENTKEA
jgi:hypothetical protein